MTAATATPASSPVAAANPRRSLLSGRARSFGLGPSASPPGSDQKHIPARISQVPEPPVPSHETEDGPCGRPANHYVVRAGRLALARPQGEVKLVGAVALRVSNACPVRAQRAGLPVPSGSIADRLRRPGRRIYAIRASSKLATPPCFTPHNSAAGRARPWRTTESDDAGLVLGDTPRSAHRARAEGATPRSLGSGFESLAAHHQQYHRKPRPTPPGLSPCFSHGFRGDLSTQRALQSLHSAAINRPPAHVDVLRHRRPRVPELVRDQPRR